MSCLWLDRGLSNGPSPKSYHSTNSTSSPSHCCVQSPPSTSPSSDSAQFDAVAREAQKPSISVSVYFNFCATYATNIPNIFPAGAPLPPPLPGLSTGCMLSITIKASIRFHNQLVQLTSLTTNKLGLKYIRRTKNI